MDLPIIEVERVSKTVQGSDGPLNILDDINFAVLSRESIAIMGVSGSGKSTLLGLLAGLDTPSDGRIQILEQDITRLDEDQRAQLRRHHIGFVFQAFHLVASFTALENVVLPLELKGNRNAAPEARAMLERVGLRDRTHHYPRQLSGGEQQRVALARAFCTSPTILFADEPTGNLDAKTADNIIGLLFELNHECDTTLVIVTHDHRVADRCDRPLELDGGRLSGSYKPPVLTKGTSA